MAIVATASVTGPTPLYSVSVDITGMTAGQVITISRYDHNNNRVRMGNTFIADTAGKLHLEDYLYPLDVSWKYEVWDSLGTTYLAASNVVGPVTSGDVPWIRDTVFPGVRRAPVVVVSLPDRSRAGQVSVYRPANKTYPVTIGDLRQASTGTLNLFCRDHAERDQLVYALSSGAPCQLYVPTKCRAVLDPMNFAPLDISETPFGGNGACVLSVEFAESDVTDQPAFQPINYAIQTTNAAAAGLKYGTLTDVPSGLSLAFLGKTYRDMYLSATGIAP